MKRRSYEPKLYFLHFKCGTWTFISQEIAYTQDEAEEISINNSKRQKEQELADGKTKKKVRIKTLLETIEEGDYKCTMCIVRRLTEVLEDMEEYFNFDDEKRSVGARVMDKLKD